MSWAGASRLRIPIACTRACSGGGLGWQRELDKSTAIEIAYAGSYADRQGMSIRQDFLPEQYWTGGNVRDTSMDAFLTANVTNPFYIGTDRRALTLLRLLAGG